MSVYHVGFVMEQALGHVTHTKNLQANVPRDPAITAHWGLVPWETTGVGGRIPLYNSNWTVRAGLRARKVVAEMVRDAPIDALFFHTQVPAVLATSWLKRFPSIVSLDATPLQYDKLGEFYQHAQGAAWLERTKWRLNRDCYAAARHIVAWSHWTKQGLVDDYNVDVARVTVIPPGVNTADWARPTPRIAHDGPVKILFVGANLARKGGHMLIDSFRALRDSANIELHLATRDDVPNEPGIHVHQGMQPNSAELKRLYHQSDIFCLPTSGDCLPMVLSEAGAAGLPTVSTDLAGIPEIVSDGETGLLIPPGDGAALTIALQRLIDNPQLRLDQGAQAVERVGTTFDAQHNAERLLALLKHEIDTARLARKVA